MKGQVKFDEFALVLLAGFILMGILIIALLTPLEFVPEVDPTEVSIALQNGSTGSFSLNVSGKISNVTIRATGEISRWIKFDDNDFDLIFGHQIVNVDVTVPSSASSGQHHGEIIVKGKGGEFKVPVTVDVSVTKRLSARSVQLGDFAVSFVSGSRTIDSKDNSGVSKGYFSGQHMNLIGSVDENEMPVITGGSIRLLVEDTNSFGNLKVYFNGVRVYDEKPGLGEVFIPLDAADIKRTNVVEVKAGNPGLIFWGSTVYRFRTASLVVDFMGTLSKEFSFTMDQSELTNFDHLQLTYRVRDSSANLPQLYIYVNNQTVFARSPDTITFNRNFDQDILGKKLVLGTSNTIKFEFKQEASYDIGNAVLTIFKREF